MKRLFEQLRRHSVALISLAVAISSLAYNTWRNEVSEANRTVRDAAIETIIGLGEFEQTIFLVRWGDDMDQRRYHLLAWAQVRSMRTLSVLFPEPGRSALLNLESTWDELDFAIQEDEDAADQMSAAIDATRDDLLIVLEMLE
ncbi:MAG: hypothetical protein AAFZ58_06450 [Pseudomonadota bacterium]